MPTTAPSNPITDARFSALKTKLRELFELDKSDLDFGIYRIMAAKNEDINDFLDRQLKGVVSKTLTEHGAGEADAIQIQLDEAIEQAKELGADPDSLPKVQELRSKLDSAGGVSASELEADIYNHLLNFFSRYYDEGDFISKRRYKGDAYAIPYSGEEVTLHWANKDQYYIKSGEWHKDYRFKIGAKSVRFQLIEATQEANNNKESDDSKRRYILDAENPIEESANQLTLRFQFRAPTATESKSLAESEPTRIFGGKYDKKSGRTKGDERELYCADAEKRAQVAMSESWLQSASTKLPTESKPDRTLLGKHINEFTARNTFDYFIHKDLGGFLSRELDFYIKNEVVRLDDLESLPSDQLQRVQGKVKAIRGVAGKLIGFLASLENFQKKLWLKKKFVLNTNWLVTIDRIPDKLRDIVTENKAQWNDWEYLGFKPSENQVDKLFSDAEWGTRAYLDSFDKLVLDTRLFDEEFKRELMASEEVLGGAKTLDKATEGLLANGENYGVLRLLTPEMAGSIKCVYTDPPYNTGEDNFVYKDKYMHSSWISMASDRCHLLKALLSPNAALFFNIDIHEHRLFRILLEQVFGDENVLSDIIWQKRSSPDARATIGSVHDSIIPVVADRTSPKSCIAKMPLSDKRIKSFLNPDNDLRGAWASTDMTGMTGRATKDQFYKVELPSGRVISPPPDRSWGLAENTFIQMRKDNRIWFGSSGDNVPRIKLFLSESDGQVVPTFWSYSDVGSNDDAQKELSNCFGVKKFTAPKPTQLIERIVSIGCKENDGRILDFFAGSGTTGHAIINSNRKDNCTRRFVLIEMGGYFNSVLRPRITKAIYSPEWIDGEAQTHDKGTSSLMKYFSVESYEDALNNLPISNADFLPDQTGSLKDQMLQYALDLKMGPHLLSLDIFNDPWGYAINAQLAGDDELKSQRVDLIETFNYLIGLKVSAYGPMERYSPEFEKAEHADDLGRLKIKGRLRRDPEGSFIFQRVEGELNDGNNTRVLVIWRKLTDNPEQDAAVLDAWMSRHRDDTKERSEHRDYHQIYINGPVTLAQPTQEIRTVFPTEETFKNRMFEDTDGTV